MTTQSVFDTSYTLAAPGGAVCILLDPFERQIANLAQLLSLSPVVCSSDAARPAFIEEYSQVARDAEGQEAVLAKVDGLLKSQANAVNALQQNSAWPSVAVMHVLMAVAQLNWSLSIFTWQRFIPSIQIQHQKSSLAS